MKIKLLSKTQNLVTVELSSLRTIFCIFKPAFKTTNNTYQTECSDYRIEDVIVFCVCLDVQYDTESLL